MKSKKKLIVALSSFAFVLVAAVVTVVAVLAATTQTITSNVSVTYVSEQVAARVSAQYQKGTQAAKDMTDGNGGTEIVFTGAESQTTPGTLTPGETIVLDFDNQTASFIYTFVNTGDAEFIATVEYVDDADDSALNGTRDTNVEVTYGSTFDQDAGEGVHQVTVAGGATETVTITVSIENVAKNAEFSGSFEWTLTENV